MTLPFFDNGAVKGNSNIWKIGQIELSYLIYSTLLEEIPLVRLIFSWLKVRIMYQTFLQDGRQSLMTNTVHGFT